MDRVRRGFARAYTRVRGMDLVRWAARRAPAGTKRRLRRIVGRPIRARGERTGGASVQRRTPHPVSAATRRAFVPDGSGSDPRANVIGHFRGASGMAEAARSLVTAAQAAEVRLALMSASPTDAAGTDLRFADSIGTDAPHPINVICVNANETTHLMHDLGPEVTSGRYSIGFWFWELSRFPSAWQAAVDDVDEIWVASRFVGETMAGATVKPVQIVRLAVDSTPSRTYRRSEFGLSDDVFTFLFTFSFNSYEARKNPAATIGAFRRAFPDGDEPVGLVIKPTNLDRGGERMRRLADAIGEDRRIHVIHRVMSRDEVYGLESVIDSYVSLHRSEGFGLGLAECMFLGKPVIGTAYSGNMEFMDETNSLLVDYRLKPVGDDEYPFPEGQVWADPDEGQAVDHMRRLAGDPAFGIDIGVRARSHMVREFSATAVGARVARRLSQILDGEA